MSRIRKSWPLVLALGVCACNRTETVDVGATGNGESRAEGQPVKKKDESPLVRAASLEPQRVEERLPCTGAIEPYHGVAVLSPARGQVTEVLVEAGDIVEEGQVLLRIDDRQAKLNVAAAKNRERDAQNRQKEAELTQLEARDRLTQAQIEHEQARRTLERTKKSREQGIASVTELEDAQLAFDKAKNALDLATTARKLADLGKEKADTELEAAGIQRRIQERVLEDYTVTAPLSGTVSRLAVKGGEWVASQTLGTLTANERLLCAVYDHRRPVINLSRPQKEFAKLRKGQRVEVHVDAYPDETFRGEIDLVSPDLDDATGTFTVRVRIQNPENKLRPGMFCRAWIITGTSQEALMIPKPAIVYEADRPFAFVVRDGKAMRIPIDRGIELKDSLEARNRADTPRPDSFAPGDQVIIEGNNKLDSGRKVKVVNE